MYLVVSFIMLTKGLVDAVMLRAQQAIAVGDCTGYLEPSHFQQIFTAHGSTMIFFVAMGLVFGVINLVLPLQIGARDVAFPFLNSLSFWLFTSGALFVLVSLVVGVFAATGWTSYPPLSGLKYSPNVGVDYWLWSIQISGIGSLISGINFLVTILKNALSWNDSHENAHFRLVGICYDDFSRFCIPHLNSDFRHALNRQTARHSYIHYRVRR